MNKLKYLKNIFCENESLKTKLKLFENISKMKIKKKTCVAKDYCDEQRKLISCDICGQIIYNEFKYNVHIKDHRKKFDLMVINKTKLMKKLFM